MLNRNELAALNIVLSERLRSKNAFGKQRGLPFPKQDLFVEDKSRFIAALCTRRAGKSNGLARRYLKTMQKYPRCLCPYLALTRDSAKNIMWEMLKEHAEEEKIQATFTEHNLTMTIENGARLQLFGADMKNFIRRLKGIKTPGAGIDESQDFGTHLITLVDDVLTPAIIDYPDGWIALTGTPGPIPYGFFYDVTDQNRYGFSVHRWSIYDNPYIDDANSFVQGNNAFLLKLDGSGNYQWAQVFGSITGLEHGYSVTTDVNGDVLIAGDFSDVTDFDPSGANTIETPIGSFDCFVSKFDASGNFLWNKVWGSTTQDVMNCVAVDAQNNVYTTGSFSGTTDFDPSGGGTFNLAPTGPSDMFVSKLSIGGSFMWARRMGGANNVRGYSLCVDPSSNVYVSGNFEGTTDFDPNAGVANLISNGSSDAFILKLDQCNVATNASSDATICVGSNALLTVSGAGTYLWSTGSTSSSILAAPIVTTTYWVQGTDFPGCTSSDTVIVFVNPVPNVALGNDTAGCIFSFNAGVVSEANTLYSWTSNPPGFTSGNPSENFYFANGPVTYYLQATYTVTGCIATDDIVIDLYSIPVVGLGSNITQCSHIVPSVNIGVTSEPNVNYNWSSNPLGFTSTNSSEIVAPPTLTTYYLNAVNTLSGCTAVDSVDIWIKPSPTLTLIGNFMNYACGGDSIRLTDILVATGGTQPYAYDWWYGNGTVPDAGTNTMYFPSSTETFSVGVVGANGCVQSNGATLSFSVQYNPTVSTDLVGHVTTPLPADVTAGLVYAFSYHPGLAFDTIATAPLDGFGKYVFTNLDNDDYLLKVIANESTYPLSIPTYYGNTFQWDSSIVVTHGCAQVDTADVQILELPPPTPGGTGFISGYVLEGPGFGTARLGPGTHPNVPFAPGGPLKGIDVKLGKNPGGGIQARVMTDTTGYYSFDSLPLDGYKIYVDIPNLPMDSTRAVDLGAGPDAVYQNNYYADSNNVYILDSVVAVGIYSSLKEYSNNFTIFPNPAKNELNIKLDVNKASDVNLILTNALGQNVYEEKLKSISSGTFTHSIEVSSLNLKAGVYFISIVNDNKKYTQRLVVVE